FHIGGRLGLWCGIGRQSPSCYWCDRYVAVAQVAIARGRVVALDDLHQVQVFSVKVAAIYWHWKIAIPLNKPASDFSDWLRQDHKPHLCHAWARVLRAGEFENQAVCVTCAAWAGAAYGRVNAVLYGAINWGYASWGES